MTRTAHDSPVRRALEGALGHGFRHKTVWNRPETGQPGGAVESKLLVRGIGPTGTKALDGPGQLEGLVSARTWGFKSPLRHPF